MLRVIELVAGNREEMLNLEHLVDKLLIGFDSRLVLLGFLLLVNACLFFWSALS